MITNEQQIWLDHLSDTDIVSIVPFDPTCESKYIQVRSKIQEILGASQQVEHRGASALGISGQNEIDLYIPVSEAIFIQTVDHLIGAFGQPRSSYPLKRARFVTFVDQKHIDIFVINQDDVDWVESERFYNHLKDKPEDLNKYRVLKESSAGMNVREYYRRKIEFINEILGKI